MLEHKIVIKFGCAENMKKLHDKGEIFMNTLQCYRKEEVGVERHDPNDGVVEMYNMRGARILRRDRVTGAEIEVATITKGVGRVTGENIDNLNVYCLFSVSIPLDKQVRFSEIIDKRLLSSFGDTAVVISDPMDFLTRIKNHSNGDGYVHARKHVEYRDLNGYHGKIGPFIKDLSYDHQKELRIAIHREKPETPELMFSVGSIEDISCMLPTKDLGDVYLESIASI